jgi:hypothetical protein
MFQIRKSASTLAELVTMLGEISQWSPESATTSASASPTRRARRPRDCCARQVGFGEASNAGRASTPRGVAVPSPEAGQACALSLHTSLTSDEYIVSDEMAGAPAGLRLLGVPVMLTKRLTQAANEHVQPWCPSSRYVAAISAHGRGAQSDGLSPLAPNPLGGLGRCATARITGES